MEERISNNIKTMSFIMTCFMVFYHCGDFSGENNLNCVLNNCFNYMGFVVMSYFFSVTGFLLMKGLNVHNSIFKIKRRFFSLLLPYVIWQTICAIPYLLRGTMSLQEYLIQNYSLKTFPINGPLWYLYAIFLLSIFCPILCVLYSNRQSAFLVTIFFTFFSQLVNSLPFESVISIANYGLISNILRYMPAYCVGMMLGRFFDDSKENLISYIVAIMICVVCLIVVRWDDSYYLVMVQLIPIMVVLFFSNISILNRAKIYKITFLIYALHGIVLSYFLSAFKNFNWGIAVSVENILVRILMLLLTVVISTAIYLVLGRISPKVLKLITGGRCVA